MEESKDTYYSILSKKLVKDKSLSKTYCSILKRFLNNKKFNASRHWNFNFEIFARQCSLINSDSSLPFEIINYKSCLEREKFSWKWKKS